MVENSRVEDRGAEGQCKTGTRGLDRRIQESQNQETELTSVPELVGDSQKYVCL